MVPQVAIAGKTHEVESCWAIYHTNQGSIDECQTRICTTTKDLEHRGFLKAWYRSTARRLSRQPQNARIWRAPGGASEQTLQAEREHAKQPESIQSTAQDEVGDGHGQESRTTGGKGNRAFEASKGR